MAKARLTLDSPLPESLLKKEAEEEKRQPLWKRVFSRGILPPVKNSTVFFSQVVLVYCVVGVALYNLTTKSGDSNLWTALLSASLGYLLPNPTIA